MLTITLSNYQQCPLPLEEPQHSPARIRNNSSLHQNHKGQRSNHRGQRSNHRGQRSNHILFYLLTFYKLLYIYIYFFFLLLALAAAISQFFFTPQRKSTYIFRESPHLFASIFHAFRLNRAVQFTNILPKRFFPPIWLHCCVFKMPIFNSR